MVYTSSLEATLPDFTPVGIALPVDAAGSWEARAVGPTTGLDALATREHLGLTYFHDAIEAGRYCVHCVDEKGDLHAFEERLQRMVRWMLEQEAGLDRAAAERRVLEHMRAMPAWRNHPRVRG